MRSFAADEVVAYQDASDKDVLRYGRVLRATDDDDGDADLGGDREEGDNDSGHFHAQKRDLNLGHDDNFSSSTRVRSVRLELSPGCIAQVLATQVYSFRAARDRPSSSSSSSSSATTGAAAAHWSGSAVSGKAPSAGAAAPAASDSLIDLATLPALQDGRIRPAVDGSPAGAAADGSGAAASAEAAATSTGNLVGAGGGSAVSSNDLLFAVEQMLASADLSLKQDQQQLMAAQLQLQAKLGHATRDLEKSREQIASLSKEVAKIPDEFRCPITCEVMTEVSPFISLVFKLSLISLFLCVDFLFEYIEPHHSFIPSFYVFELVCSFCARRLQPVICSDGHTYERSAIERWLQSHGTSPKTNARLPNRTVMPNHNLRGVIEAYHARRRNHTQAKKL